MRLLRYFVPRNDNICNIQLFLAEPSRSADLNLFYCLVGALLEIWTVTNISAISKLGISDGLYDS